MTDPWTLSRIAEAAVPGRSEYGNTCRCVSGEAGRYVEVRREVGVGLTRESDDHVGADRRVRQARDDAVHEARGSSRACRAGASPRASDRSRAAAAGGNAAGTGRWPRRTSTIAGVQSIGSSELMRNVTSPRDRVERAQQIEQRRRRVAGRARTIRDGRRSAMTSLKPAAADALDLGDESRDRQAAGRAAGRRDDAVGALLLAAGLRADGERRAAGDAGFDRRRRRGRRRRPT